MEEGKKGVKYSLVIPCYNKNGNLSILHNEIKKVMSSITDQNKYEIIYVNDGSISFMSINLKPHSLECGSNFRVLDPRKS